MRTLDQRTNSLTSNCSCNATDATWKLGSPEARIVEIAILICLMTSLMVFLAVFGTWRRRSRSACLKAVLWMAYTTSAFLIPYILGLIQDAQFKDKLFVIWGMLLLIAYAFPDSFSAYSPEDVTQWKLHYIQFLVKFWGLAILWIKSKAGAHSEFGVLCLFTSIVFVKVVKRSIAQIVASPSYIEERAKLFEVYMKHEHELSSPNAIDPLTMRGYKYLVAVAGSKKLFLEDVLAPSTTNLTNLQGRSEVVTLENVWSCEGRLLTESRDPDGRLKDICLSYSLLKILYLKCAGYDLPEEAQPKARKLILEGLLSDNERTIRAIEVELKLLYELIYTKYHLYTLAIFAGVRAIEFVLLLLVCVLSAAYISKHGNSNGCIEVSKVRGLYLDVLLTYILLGMIVFAEIAQMAMIFSSEWVKAALIFNYVAKKYCLNNRFVEKLIMMVCKPWFWKPWARMLGQYSLIESPGYGIGMSISAIASLIYPDRNRDWQNERKAIHLSDEVKRAVLNSLRTHETNLGNGRSSLRRNGVHERFSGACEGKHKAEVILVWHIATSYCLHRSSVSSSSKKDCAIANDLSNYLAYLVAFGPRLLPGPHFEPQFHFRRVMKVAREEFKGYKKVEDRIKKLDELAVQPNQEDQSIIMRGARLGKQLSQLGNVWKILAEFWSEMALCAATSGEVRAHLEKLANGGEFITHLWALLHHVGYCPAHPAAPL